VHLGCIAHTKCVRHTAPRASRHCDEVVLRSSRDTQDVRRPQYVAPS
jgi:hypothetical protein